MYILNFIVVVSFWDLKDFTGKKIFEYFFTVDTWKI